MISLYKCPEAREHSFIHSLIHSFNKHFSSTYYVEGTLLGAGVGYSSEPGKQCPYSMALICWWDRAIQVIQ